MTVTDMFIPYNILNKNDVQERYLPDIIKETAMIWVNTYDKGLDKDIPMLVSRSWLEKMNTSSICRPALGLWEILYLVTHRLDTNSFNLHLTALSQREEFMKEMGEVAILEYNSIRSKILDGERSRSQPEARIGWTAEAPIRATVHDMADPPTEINSPFSEDSEF